MKKAAVLVAWFAVAIVFIAMFTVTSAEAKSLKKGEEYKKQDGDTIRVISSDELEIKYGSDIFLVKYTVDGERVRVVTTVLGTPKVLYYKIIPDGLVEDKNYGEVFYSKAVSASKLALDSARAYLMKGQYEKAINDCNKAISLDSNNAESYAIRGIAYFKNNQYEKAIEDINKAISLKPDYYPSYTNRGDMYSSKGEYARALKDYDKAISLKPDNYPSYASRGIAYYKIGVYDRAIEDFNKAISLEPDQHLPYANRGIVYVGKGEYDRAIEDYNKAISLKPNFPQTYASRGKAYQNKGNHKMAIADFNKACELGDNKGCELAKAMEVKR